MASSDVFAMDRSPFNSFLRAEIGVEANGSSLTMLSALARVGVDPWVEAAGYVSQPRGASLRRLCDLIAQTGLPAISKQDAPTIAARLFTLLPCRSETAVAASSVPTPRVWVLTAVFCAIMGIAFLATGLLTPELGATAALAASDVSAPDRVTR